MPLRYRGKQPSSSNVPAINWQIPTVTRYGGGGVSLVELCRIEGFDGDMAMCLPHNENTTMRSDLSNEVIRRASRPALPTSR